MKKKKLGILLLIMMLGVCSSAFAQADAIKDKSVEKPVQEQDRSQKTVENKVQPTSETTLKNMDTMEKAHYAISIKDYQSAIVYLTNYITSKPKKYEAYKLRGECFYALRQYKLAQNDFQTAINLKTSDDKFITGTKVLGAMVLGADKQEQYQNPELGNLYGQLMYAQKASNSSTYEASYQKAFEYNSHIYLPQPKKEDIAKINCPQKYGKILNPQGIDEYIYGAIEDIEKNNYSDAVSKSLYVIEKFPRYYLGYYLYGVALAGVDQGKEAVEAFESALKHNPYDFESLASLGKIYYNDAEKTFSFSDAEKSISYFEEALKYNPNCYLYYYYIGLNNLLMNNYDAAVSGFNNAIKFKSNDYNSMYYKLIAQYVQGDYNAVIEGTTRLLYRHVSNYNSVLYLRALAYYKIGAGDSALVDIERIHNNMNDIYNADLKNLSPKEQTLNSYLYYLKAQILRDKGYGTKADFDKALANPIIAELSKIEISMRQYSKSLSNSNVSMDEYNKYKQLYNNQLESLLKNTHTVTYDDINNQYDYIRTAFDSLKISFAYMNPDYKIVKGIDNINTAVSADKNNKVLKQATSPDETLIVDNKSSIAQMLASQSLNVALNKSPELEVDDVVRNINKDSIAKPLIQSDGGDKVADSNTELSEDNLPEAKAIISGNSEKEVEKIDETQPEVKSGVVAAEEKTESERNDVTAGKFEDKLPELRSSYNSDTKPEQIPVAKAEEQKTDTVEQTNLQSGTISSVAEIPEQSHEGKEVQHYTEQKSVEKIDPGSVAGVVGINQVQKVKEQNTKVSCNDSAKESKQVSDNGLSLESKTQARVNEKELNVVEKHARVNQEDFNIIHKPAPVISEDDEVVVFEPPMSFMQGFVKPSVDDSKTDLNEVDVPSEIEEGIDETKEQTESENTQSNVIIKVEETNVATISEKANTTNVVEDIVIPPEMDKIAQEVQSKKLSEQKETVKSLNEAGIESENLAKGVDEFVEKTVTEDISEIISEKNVSTDIDANPVKVKKLKNNRIKKSKKDKIKAEKVAKFENDKVETGLLPEQNENKTNKSWFERFKFKKMDKKTNTRAISENSVQDAVLPAETGSDLVPKLPESGSGIVDREKVNVPLLRTQNSIDEIPEGNVEQADITKIGETKAKSVNKSAVENAKKSSGIFKRNKNGNLTKSVNESDPDRGTKTKIKREKKNNAAEKSKFSFKKWMFWKKEQTTENGVHSTERKVIKQLSQ